MSELPTTMRAQRLDTAARTFSVQDVPVPQPGPGEVLIEVAFCGICHSDLSLIDGTFPAQLPVVTQGHEASGTIAALGAGFRHGRERCRAQEPDAAAPAAPRSRAQSWSARHGHRLR